MQDSLISTISLKPLLVELRQRGIDPDEVLEPKGLSAVDITQPLQRVPESVLWEIWEAAVSRSDDLALGVTVGCRFEPQSLGILGHIISNSATLADALAHWRRYASLIDDRPIFSLQRRAGHMGLEMRRRPDIDPRRNRSLVEFTLFSVMRLLGYLQGSPELNGAQIPQLDFRHPPPPRPVLQAYEQALPGTAFRFSQVANTLWVDEQLLDQPVSYADPQMLELMADRARLQLAERHRGDFMVLRVRHAIRRQLASGPPSISVVASDCATSRSSLQRALKNAGVSFRELLAEVRRERAFELLRDGQRQVDEIAALLAYSEPAAFIHAFRRWTGTTPRVWREREQLGRRG